MLFSFAASGATLGALAGHLLVRPVYSSVGWLLIDAPVDLKSGSLAAPPPLTLAVVTTALAAARQNPSGISLPASPSDAFGHASIYVRSSNELIGISYQASNPNAAACMAREILKAYMKSISANVQDPRSGAILMVPLVPAYPVRNAGIPLGGLIGAAVGVALFLTWGWLLQAGRGLIV
jgi:uncharacterized protein involved in exopolysaccharide biosynthesis